MSRRRNITEQKARIIIDLLNGGAKTKDVASAMGLDVTTIRKVARYGSAEAYYQRQTKERKDIKARKEETQIQMDAIEYNPMEGKQEPAKEDRERIKEILLKQMELLQEENARLYHEGKTLDICSSFLNSAEAMCHLTAAYCWADSEQPEFPDMPAGTTATVRRV